MHRKGISDLDLLEYIAGRLDAKRRQEIDTLLRDRARDRERLAALRCTWDVMGQWDVQTGEHDLVPQVMDKIASRQTRMTRLTTRQTIAKIAAMWLIAVGGGFAAGRIALSRRTTVPSPDESAPALVLEQDVAEALHLDVLGGAVGLAHTMLEDTELPHKETHT